MHGAGGGTATQTATLTAEGGTARAGADSGENAHDADGGRTPFNRWIGDGLARYVDQKKFPAILAQAGLQLPSTAQNKPGTSKILTEKNLAGYRRAAMGRGTGPGLSVDAASSIAAAVRKAWGNGPNVIVVADMADPRIPQAVRDYDAELRQP